MERATLEDLLTIAGYSKEWEFDEKGRVSKSENGIRIVWEDNIRRFIQYLRQSIEEAGKDVYGIHLSIPLCNGKAQQDIGKKCDNRVPVIDLVTYERGVYIYYVGEIYKEGDVYKASFREVWKKAMFDAQDIEKSRHLGMDGGNAAHMTSFSIYLFPSTHYGERKPDDKSD